MSSTRISIFWKTTLKQTSIFSDNPSVSFRHSKHFRETLVHSSLSQASASRKGTSPCLSSKCKTCDFVDSTTIVSAPKSEYHIKHHFTSASSHLIYCISCTRCGILCIGETGRCLIDVSPFSSKRAKHRGSWLSKSIWVVLAKCSGAMFIWKPCRFSAFLI
jgi:hypothetical protein